MTAGRTVNSQSVDWCTPKKYVNAAKRVFGGRIALDPCSNEWSIVGAEREDSLPERDGLTDSWDFPTIYVNPPYGADKERRTTIKHWLIGAHMCTSIMGPRSWHWSLWPRIRATGRSTFGVGQRPFASSTTRDLDSSSRARTKAKGAVKCRCAMIYWNKNTDAFLRVFNEFGEMLTCGRFKAWPLAERESCVNPSSSMIYEKTTDPAWTPDLEPHRRQLAVRGVGRFGR